MHAKSVTTPIESESATVHPERDVNRRELLKRLGVGLALLSVSAVAFADPDEQSDGDDDGKRSGSNTAFGKGIVDLGPVNSFKLGAVVDKSAQAGAIVTRSQQGLIALVPICTHQGCNTHYSSATAEFICPCHGARFALNGGAVTAGPARTPLSRYALSVKNGRVLIDTNRLIKRMRVSSSDFLTG